MTVCQGSNAKLLGFRIVRPVRIRLSVGEKTHVARLQKRRPGRRSLPQLSRTHRNNPRDNPHFANCDTYLVPKRAQAHCEPITCCALSDMVAPHKTLPTHPGVAFRCRQAYIMTGDSRHVARPIKRLQITSHRKPQMRCTTTPVPELVQKVKVPWIVDC